MLVAGPVKDVARELEVPGGRKARDDGQPVGLQPDNIRVHGEVAEDGVQGREEDSVRAQPNEHLVPHVVRHLIVLDHKPPQGEAVPGVERGLGEHLAEVLPLFTVLVQPLRRVDIRKLDDQPRVEGVQPWDHLLPPHVAYPRPRHVPVVAVRVVHPHEEEVVPRGVFPARPRRRLLILRPRARVARPQHSHCSSGCGWLALSDGVPRAIAPRELPCILRRDLAE
mmetsp:Transcript_126768/g.219576  ORF Transcript_126768/g.219576 Transcript_126768/m.219576 type:complete len:224 (-) Transcript_126768:272-943(-)